MTAEKGSRSLGATVRAVQGAAIVDLRGDIDARAEDALNDAYTRAEGADAAVIVLNFAEVGYINSTGIALIVALLGRARASGCRLSVVGLSEHYREIFTITRLSDFMNLFADEASALAAATGR